MRDEFAEGFTYWWRGWGLLWRSRALGFYAFLPLVLAGGFFVTVLWMAFNYVPNVAQAILQRVFPAHELWSGILYYPMWLTLFLLAFVALIYVSYLVHVVVCGPFYSMLADRALHDLGKNGEKNFRITVHALLASVLKAALFFGIGTAIFIFSFVPLVNVVGLILALMIVAFDTMDYSFEAMGMGLRERLRYFFQHLPQWLGMASSLALTMLIPGLTLLILPGAVVGAAMIFDSKTVNPNKG